MNSLNLHFIFGLGRSGTTLLQKELGKMNGVIANPESLYLLEFLYRIPKNKALTSTEIDAILERMFALKTGHFVSLDLWDIDKIGLRSYLKQEENVTFFTLVEAINRFSKAGQKVEHPQVIFDKNPPHTLHIPKLLTFSDNGLAIGIYRHYWDNILSRFEYRLDAIRHPLYHALIWVKYNTELRQQAKKFPTRLKLVGYEDFVQNSEKQLVDLQHFFGLNQQRGNSDEQALMSHLLEKITDEKEKAYFMKMHGKVFQPIDAAAVGKKEHPFTPTQVAAIHHICGELAEKLGYEKVPGGAIPIKERLLIGYFRLHIALLHRIHCFYYQSPLWVRKLGRTVRRFGR